MITGRDRQIINLLQDRGFCLYKDITKKFFPSEVSACNRLKKLRDKGWLIIEPINSFYHSNNINDLSLHLMGDNKKIIRLNNKHKVIKGKQSRWKMEQQLILFSLKERLESFLGQTAVFKNEIIIKPTFYNGDYEPLPDFYINCENYKLAVELDLHLRRNSRYHSKIDKYMASSFTHVLYVLTNMRKVGSFIKAFRHRKYVSMIHYSNEKKVISYWYAEIPLSEWLRKKLK